MEKCLVLNLTNGEGYSSPNVDLLARTSALNLFYSSIGAYTFNESYKLEERGFDELSSFCTFTKGPEDNQDNFGVHLISVKSGDILCIETCYVNDIKKVNNISLGDFIADLDLGEYDDEEEIIEDSHEARETHITTKDGQLFIFIEIK